MNQFYPLKFLAPNLYKSIYFNLGIRNYYQLARHLYQMVSFDFFNGVNTRKIIPASQLKFSDEEVQRHAVRYRPSPVFCIEKGFKSLVEIDPDIRKSRVIDYGCGAGRVMFIASRLGFHTITGIELSPFLVDLCKRNIDRFKRMENSSLEVIETNAATYDPPTDACVFFFFRPFNQLIFDGVLERIEESLMAKRRVAYLLTLQSNYELSKEWKSIRNTGGVSVYSKSNSN